MRAQTRSSFQRGIANVLVLLFFAAPADAQEANSWTAVINALKWNAPEVVQRVLQGCVRGNPGPQQEELLGKLLPERDIKFRSRPAQQAWIASVQCSSADGVGVGAQSAVVVVSDRLGESVLINGMAVGASPAALRFDTTTVVRVVVGTGMYLRDTIIDLTAGDSLVVALRTVERQAGPVPDRARLREELSSRFSRVPVEPSVPVAPRKPGMTALVLATVGLGGAAYAGAASPCTKWATVPSPFGGFRGGQFFPPGYVSPELQTQCKAAAFGGGAVAGGLVSFLVSRTVRRSRATEFSRRQATYQALYVAREEVIRANERLLDSVFAFRAAEASKRVVERTWVITRTTRQP